ncbi:hypothetical protein LPJ66_004829 [Kickxella alabastrina]|uniref:Uncharacterized protein n=1 Tax=Kickxella alabastrina TaxID=61397 RepID=A0ACC1IK17_9FUNG|nr:hypothetical protein LPJ66_004829 [Kickxella alabastrina]
MAQAAATNAAEWQVRVKALMEGVEKEFNISTQPDETVGAFRIKLTAKSQVEPQKQRLIFRGRVLNSDTIKLIDAGISNGSALHMVTRPADSAGTQNDRPAPQQQQGVRPRMEPGVSPLAATILERAIQNMINSRAGAGTGGISLTFEFGDGGFTPVGEPQHIPVPQPRQTRPQPGPPQQRPQQQLQPQPWQQLWQQPLQQQSQGATADSRVQTRQQRRTQMREDFATRVRQLRAAQGQQDQSSRSTITGLFRDFGRDDGGQWVAEVSPAGFIPIEREASAGIILTDDELRRSPVVFFDGMSPASAPPEAAYLAIPGLSRIEESARPTNAAGPRLDQQPSRAQANELVYNLLERVLPDIRRLPGRSDFEFGAERPAAPEYIGQSTADPVGATGAAMAGLGDAFMEVGRSLRAVGGQWQDIDNVPPEGAYTPAHMTAIHQAISNLVLASSVSVPFLRSTPAQLAQAGTVSWDTNRELSIIPEVLPQAVNDAATAMPERTSYLFSSMFHRENRRRVLDMLTLDTIRQLEERPLAMEDAPHINLAALNWSMAALMGSPEWQQMRSQQSQPQLHQLGSRIFPHMNLPTQAQTQTQAQAQTQTQPQAQAQRLQMQQPNTADSVAEANRHRGANPTTGNTTATQGPADAHSMRAPAVQLGGEHQFEIVFGSIDMSEALTRAADIRSRIGNIGNNTDAQATPQNPRPTRPQQPAGQQGTARANANSNANTSGNESREGHPANTPRSGSPDGDFFTFIDRLGAMSSQTARSDRSNMSTTTEYSVSNGQTAPMPRILAFGSGIGSQLLPLQAGGNPFPIASIFLGTEPGSLSPTRRTSMASSVNGQPGGDNNSNASASASAPALAPAPAAAASAPATISATTNINVAGHNECPSTLAVVPESRSNDKRTHTASFSNDNHSHNIGSSDNSRSAGNSSDRKNPSDRKRHKAGDSGDDSASELH